MRTPQGSADIVTSLTLPSNPSGSPSPRASLVSTSEMRSWRAQFRKFFPEPVASACGRGTRREAGAFGCEAGGSRGVGWELAASGSRRADGTWFLWSEGAGRRGAVAAPRSASSGPLPRGSPWPRTKAKFSPSAPSLRGVRRCKEQDGTTTKTAQTGQRQKAYRRVWTQLNILSTQKAQRVNLASRSRDVDGAFTL